ncbi:MAG: CerR family C-terminal domain-containing protein [Humidesulfovibrio sp.]|uniref:CerR family C-terminal domain-containing protein n=1 Tax=Humidesulfovibrio sp. TaxID=2910988 RepID=UPI0027375B4B|nr:CerR family C-terminal domain-containing protein [Humidesulfovibrio sp.]MDP2847313.1 CerR family C-terminal domain-containing protein [Humidesulfovibrio sp.]
MQQVELTDTKRRLMDAAGEIFSEKGFKAATVREICRHANANVAAVHYHFGDKAGLYKSLLVEAFEAGLKRYPPHMNLGPEASGEQRLYAFIHSFLLRMLGGERFAWCGKLMARELQEPTEALDHIVERYIRPLSEQLRSIVAEVLGNGAQPDDQRTQYCAMSVVGQCQYVFRSRSVIGRLIPSMRFDEAGIATLAQHIADFSLSALKNMPKPDETRS